MKEYFYGWYFKCQSNTQTLAIIPAVHESNGKQTFSIQVITEDETWNINFDESTLQFSQRNYFTEKRCQIERNVFEESGLQLQIDAPQLKANGTLQFSNLSPLKYDIMGPFAFVPFMECRHSVYSMEHRVDGTLCINGKDYVFENAYGYWEGDRGRSFPKEYAWTQCFLNNKESLPMKNCSGKKSDKDAFSKGAIMLSVADIPLAGVHFTGIIGIVRWKGKEYRFATYLGARVLVKEQGRILVRQGQMELEARLLEKNAFSLQAPINGEMSRTIRENARCKAFYRLRKNGQTIFALKTDQASFEFEYE